MRILAICTLVLAVLAMPFVSAHALGGDMLGAARAGKAELIGRYVEQGGDVEMTDDTGYTAFILAAYHGHDALLQDLLGYGANPCAQDARGNTALMGVAFRGHMSTARWLLQHAPCDINHRNHAGQTALMMAALFGRSELVELLLHKGADAGLVDNQGNTAASLARMQGNDAVLAILPAP